MTDACAHTWTCTYLPASPAALSSARMEEAAAAAGVPPPSSGTNNAYLLYRGISRAFSRTLSRVFTITGRQGRMDKIGRAEAWSAMLDATPPRRLEKFGHKLLSRCRSVAGRVAFASAFACLLVLRPRRDRFSDDGCCRCSEHTAYLHNHEILQQPNIL